MDSIIYKATNKINGKAYVGQTVKSLRIRISEHIHDALNNKDNVYFHNAIRRYGKENFIWEIIAECSSLKELNKTEIEMIKKYNTFENGYNLTRGGEGSVGFKHTQKAKEKISKSKRGKNHPNYGKHHTEETKRRIGNGNRGKVGFKGEDNPMYGKHHSEETKRKISELRKNKKLSDETRRKISEALKGEKNHMYGKYGKDSPCFGKKRSEETRQKISLALKGKYGGKNSSWYGKRHSEATKKKMSKSMIGKQVGSKSLIAKKYIVITPKNKEIFVHGLRNFCKNYSEEALNSSTLTKVAKGKLKHHKGYKCRYWEEETCSII